MKRLTLLVSIVALLATAAFAQSSRHTDFRSLEKKVKKSDSHVAHPKKSLKPSTWLKRADIMEEVFFGYPNSTTIGMDPNAFMLIVGTVQGQRTEKVQEVEYTVYELPRTDFYFADNKMAFYRVKDALFPRPLDSAFVALKRAISLDEKERYTDKIRKELIHIRGLMLNSGVNSYSGGDFDEAMHAFKQTLAMDQMPIIGKVDSSIYFYIGTAAYQAKKYSEAADYFLKAIRAGYTDNGIMYCSYYDACNAAGESTKARPILMEGVDKFPDQKCIVLNLINFLIQQKENPEIVLPYLSKAIERDPKNEVLYFVQGVVYDQLGKPEESEKAYREAIAVKPDYTDAYYNIATLHYNTAVKMLQEAAEMPTNASQKEYDALIDRSNSEFKASIKPAEEVLEIDPNYFPALDLLKAVYFRFRTEPGMQEKHEKVQAKLKELGK